MNKNVYIYFSPMVVLATAWLLILFVREFSLFDFDPLPFYSSLYLLLFILLFLSGSFTSIILLGNGKVYSRPVYSAKSVNVKANGLIFLSLVSICLLVYKFLTLVGGGFSLADITELRMSRGRDPGDIKGGMVSGVLGMILSGCTIILYIYKEFFFDYLSKRKRMQMNLIFVGGIFVSFLSGGRWAATVALVVVLIVYFLRKYVYEVEPKLVKVYRHSKPKKSFFQMLARFFLYLIIGYIFARFFLDRAVSSGDDFSFLLGVLSNNFDGVSVPVAHENFLWEYPDLIPIYYVVALLQYYAGHALYQFGVLSSADYPLSAPYLGAYQFYLQASLLNKFGFDLTPVSQILSEIVNPGVYFTLAGAFLLDFGYWGGLLLIFFVSFAGSYFWVKFLRLKRFLDMYISILFFVLILFSPIVAITATGVYPSLLSLAIVFKLFVPRLQGSVNA